MSFSRPVMMWSTQPVLRVSSILCTLLGSKFQSRTMKCRTTGCTVTRSATEKNTTGTSDPITYYFLQGSRVNSIYNFFISTSKRTLIC